MGNHYSVHTGTIYVYTDTLFIYKYLILYTHWTRTYGHFFCLHIQLLFLFRTYKLEVPLIQMLIIRLVPQWDTTKHDEDTAFVIGRFKLTLCCCLI